MAYYQPGGRPSWRKFLSQWVFITCVFEVYIAYSLWSGGPGGMDAPAAGRWAMIMPVAALPLALLLNFFHSGSDDQGCD